MAFGKTSSSVWLVLHLSPRKRGSMEEQLLAVAQRLHASGVSLTCVFAAEPAPWMADELRGWGVDTRTLDFSRPFDSALRLYRWLGENRPQLVHFHFVRAYSPLVAAARLAGATVLVNDHVTLTRASESPAREALKRVRDAALNPLCDLRVAVSRVVKQSVIDVEHVAPSHVVVLENGIDVERFQRADGAEVRRELGIPTRPMVAVVSRLSSEKGVESAIRMMPILDRGAVLLLIGDGKEEPRFRALADELRLGDAVRFLGVRDDVERILAAADVVVVPSHWEEAFGLAVVEGMAAGRPVVVSRSGAMPDLVGNTGLVVPKKDPAALAAAVACLLDDPMLRARLGRAAQARARERYGMVRYVDEVVGLYRRMCPPLFQELAA
jgi:glycosyltransferase involved in cell wall biosynthesis